MLNIIRDEFESIKVKAETKKCNMLSMEEIRIKQEKIIDKLRGRKNNKVKEETKVEEPVIKITPKKVKVPRKDIVEIDRRKNKENDDRLRTNNVETKKEEKPINTPRREIVEIDRRKNKENDDRINNKVKEETKVEEVKPEVKEETKVEEVKPEVKEEKMDEIDYLIKYAQSLEDEDIMNATVEDLLSDPTLYEDYDVDVIYDDYDYINEDFYRNCNEPIEEPNVIEHEEKDNIEQFNDEEKSKTEQWIEGIMNSTSNINDLFNQCKKTDDKNNE